MTWVKVCGLRTPGDVSAAREAGADAIGLVLAESPRRVVPERARELAGMSGAMSTFLLTVDATPGQILDLAAFCGVSGVQPYGAHVGEAAAAAVRAGLQVLRPVRVETSVDVAGVPTDQTPLLDAAAPGRMGGTGVSFDWGLAAEVDRRFVLAGGLDPDNVAGALAAARAWGVDASSGLESAPGVKDHTLIHRFVEEAKRS